MSSSPSAAASQSGSAALPFLPGYRVELGPKERYHKAHIFDLSNGIRVDMNKDKLDARARQITHTRSGRGSDGRGGLGSSSRYAAVQTVRIVFECD